MKKIEVFLVFLFSSSLLWGLQALADSSVPVSSVSPLPGILAALQHVDSVIPGPLSAGMITIIIFAIEILMRVIPSAQPRSLLLLFSAGLKALSDICAKLSSLLDQIVQNLTS